MRAADDVFARSRAVYAGLRTYSDSGEIVTEELPPGAARIVERHTFTTFYRAPRQFFFEFKKDPKAGGERFVIWSDGAEFNTWWSATKVHETYPKGRGTLAFALGAMPTKGSAVRIPALLFAQAGLQGPLASLNEARPAGTEDIDGTKCEKVTGAVVLTYAETGHAAAPRPTTVWIDPQTLMVRKIFEDTPKDATPGSYSRVTTIIHPRANPEIDDARFRFTPPDK